MSRTNLFLAVNRLIDELTYKLNYLPSQQEIDAYVTEERVDLTMRSMVPPPAESPTAENHATLRPGATD